MAERPLFLERRGYRLRRMMDAVRLLPFLGLGLWLVPLLWPRGDGAAGEAVVSGSVALRYVFGVWAGMTLAALFLWLRTRRRGDAEEG